MQHPGEFLRERFLVPLGLSSSAFARAIGVPRSRVSELLSGRRRITANTAVRLGLYFGVEPTVFLDRQTAWDLRLIELRLGGFLSDALNITGFVGNIGNIYVD